MNKIKFIALLAGLSSMAYAGPEWNVSGGVSVNATWSNHDSRVYCPPPRRESYPRSHGHSHRSSTVVYSETTVVVSNRPVYREPVYVQSRPVVYVRDCPDRVYYVSCSCERPHPVDLSVYPAGSRIEVIHVCRY